MNGERHPNVLDRALRLFADVKAGEGANVLILAVNVFLLLTACLLYTSDAADDWLVG